MSVIRWLFLACFVLLPALPGAVAAEVRPARVLMLFSQDRNLPWQVEVDRGLTEELKKSPRPVEIYGEYLDAGRFPDADKAEAMAAFLASKYGDIGVDVLLGEGARAGNFIQDHPALLPSARRVLVNFAGAARDGALSIPIRSDFSSALAEIKAVTGARRVVVVADTGDGAGKQRVALFRAAVEQAGDLEAEYLLDLPLEKVGERLAALGKESAAYYLLMFRDGLGGAVLSPYEAAQAITRRSAVPVFSHWTSLLGSGIAGGYMISGERVGAAAAKVAVTLAEGRVASVEEASGAAYGSYYDWRQLKRYGISEDHLLAGVKVLWKTPTFFDEYRWPIILVLSFTLSLAIMVVALLRLDLSRRHALTALASEREHLEERVAERTAALSRATTALESSNQELQQFAYAVSHDLQEPLRSITGYLQLLDRTAGPVLTGEPRQFLAIAVDGGRRMHAMIKDLLEYSRLGTGELQAAPVNCAAAVAEALDNLHQGIEESGATVIAEDLPEVKASAAQLTRLFQNLIGNAIKYADPARPPQVRVSAERDGDFWTFSVADNGIGIAPEFAERVFILFQRLHGRGQYDGNGVGLALCRRIVERHGGKIWVEGRPGGGSVFRFTLPVAEGG
jgi:signal transduction histidine kinase